MKTKHLFFAVALAAALLGSTSCKKEDIPAPAGYTMMLKTTLAVGENIKLYIDAELADQSGVWIDLNNNGTQDAGENAVTFAKNTDYKLGSQTITLHGKVTKFVCRVCKITQLTVSDNPALHELNCFDNELTALDISKNTALTELVCFFNRLTALDISKNTALKGLYCDLNQLTALDVSNNTALTALNCSTNQLTALDVSKNTALTKLVCYNNQLTALNVSNNTALTELRCYENQLTTLDVSKNTALTGLYCYDNQLTTLDVSKNTALTELHCYSNQIKSVAMKTLLNNLPQLTNPAKVYIWNKPDGNEKPLFTLPAERTMFFTILTSKKWTLYQFDGVNWVPYP